jgi:hypothetical protein
MKKFIDEIFIPFKNSFTIHIDYSHDEFVKRLIFKLSDESVDRNLESFLSLEIAKKDPLIQLLLNYIRVSDDYRKVMTAYICGSFCYIGTIKISIYTNPSPSPFKSQTCFKLLNVFIRPSRERAFDWLLKQKVNNDISPIEKLYNVFLDKTTQNA